jgi:hypothetical protein
MPRNTDAIVATMGIDIGKNAFHVVGLDRRGVIILRRANMSLRLPHHRTEPALLGRRWAGPPPLDHPGFSQRMQVFA